MNNLLKAEFFKLHKSFGYKVLLAVCVCIGVIFGIVVIRNGSGARGADYAAIMGSGFLYNVVLVSVFAAGYIGSAYSNRTFAAEIACGASRRELFTAKSIVFFIAILPLILVYDLVTICILTVQNGFGMPWNMETIRFLTQRIVFSILCNYSMGSCILLNAYLVKNQVAAIGSAIGSLYLLNQCCINERNPMLLKVWQFTFFYQIDSWNASVRPMHFRVPFGTVVLSSLIAIAGMTILAGWSFQRRDLR